MEHMVQKNRPIVLFATAAVATAKEHSKPIQFKLKGNHCHNCHNIHCRILEPKANHDLFYDHTFLDDIQFKPTPDHNHHYNHNHLYRDIFQVSRLMQLQL